MQSVNSKKLDHKDPKVKRVTLLSHTMLKPIHKRIEVFSKWTSAVKAIRVLQQAMCSRKNEPVNTVSALKKAEMCPIKATQQDAHRDKINSLSSAGQIKKASPLTKLNPFNSHGILRVGSRL